MLQYHEQINVAIVVEKSMTVTMYFLIGSAFGESGHIAMQTCTRCIFLVQTKAYTCRVWYKSRTFLITS